MVQTTTLGDLGSAMGVGPSSQPAAPQPKMDAKGRSYATGRRKDAVARVWLKRGAGRISVNCSAHHILYSFPTRPLDLGGRAAGAHAGAQWDAGAGRSCA